jgi:hypothetical protein
MQRRPVGKRHYPIQVGGSQGLRSRFEADMDNSFTLVLGRRCQVGCPEHRR